MAARPRAVAKPRVFISYDYDNDRFLKEALVQQSRRKGAPFEIADWSVKQASRGWRKDARDRIRRSDIVIAICGHHTHKASGVAEEIEIARDEQKSVYLLAGHKDGVRKPRGCFFSRVHAWNHENLVKMTTGQL